MLNLTNNVSLFNGNIMEGIVNLTIQPVSSAATQKNPNNNAQFDLFSFDTGANFLNTYTTTINCYVNNINQVAGLYSQYRSCS